MLKEFLQVSLYSQCKRAFLARKTNFYNINCKSIRYASPKNHDDDDEFDKPIQYSTSPAASWTAAKSRNPLGDRHPYESSIISTSLAVFLLYFLVLREENDIDLIFNKELTEHYPGIMAQPVSRSKQL